MAFNRCPKCSAYQLLVYAGKHLDGKCKIRRNIGGYRRYYKCLNCNHHLKTTERVVDERKGSFMWKELS